MRKWMAARFRHDIKKTLALRRRGAVRTDGLTLHQVSTRLEIAWSARDVHPWDRGDAPEKKVELMLKQAMEDAEAAINGLFENLPQIDAIEVTVLEPGSKNIIMAGTVHRPSSAANGSSVKMRLMNWGIRFDLEGSQLGRFNTP
jgi:hypothetical protein